MKKLLYVSTAVCILSALLVLGCAKPYVITTNLEQPLAATSVVTVGDVTDDLPVDFDASKKPTAADIERFKGLILAELAETELFSVLSGADSAQYQVKGSILDYKKGSGAVRFFIGFGLGNAKVTTTLSLVNLTSNQVVFAGNFQGTVSEWGSKGNKVFDKAAKNFAKALKKRMKELKKQQSG